MSINTYGICHLSVIPVRAESSDKSEIVTQLLFAETFLILNQKEQWLKIKLDFDGYEGWVDKKQCSLIDENTFLDYKNNSTVFNNEIFVKIPNQYQILLGSPLPFYQKEKFYFLKKEIKLNSTVITPQEPETSSIINTAQKYLGTPYLWGGRTPFGIDCSGFTQMVYKLNGINILRDASQQATQGEIVDFEKRRVGDLAFFGKEKNKITHVGILLPDNKIIHASGEVRIDELTNEGIFNQTSHKITHHLQNIQLYF